jgi:acyl carrier protein
LTNEPFWITIAYDYNKGGYHSMAFERVKKMILNELKVEESKITLEARLQEDLGADSLDAVELIMNIEDEFDISISDEAAQNLKTVGDLVKYIESQGK